MNLYETLDVDENASKEEIRKSFKKKASKCHPDKNQTDPEAKEKFQQLQKAYSVLSNDIKRRRYDQTGRDDNQPSLDELANQVIAKLFLEISKQSGYRQKDYFQDVIKSLQNSLSQCLEDKRKFNTVYNKLKYLIDKTEADSYLIHSLTSQLMNLKQDVNKAEHAAEIMHRALELLDKYKYTGAEPRPSSTGFTPWDNPDNYFS